MAVDEGGLEAAALRQLAVTAIGVHARAAVAFEAGVERARVHKQEVLKRRPPRWETTEEAADVCDARGELGDADRRPDVCGFGSMVRV